MTTAEHIRPVLDHALTDGGLVLEDLTITPAGRRRVVRVAVDRALGDVYEVSTPTAPLTLDEVADATRAVSDALDGSEVMGEQAYTLEVTSPGVGRPLTDPRHFQRNVGRLVTLHRHDGAVTGRITRASRTEVTLEVPGAKGVAPTTETVPYAGVERAAIEVEFARHDETKES
ncbi:MAG: ribosome maturation factor RimP [Ornithinibacter sp.]